MGVTLHYLRLGLHTYYISHLWAFRHLVVSWLNPACWDSDIKPQLWGILTSKLRSHLSGFWHPALYPICGHYDIQHYIPSVGILTSSIISHLWAFWYPALYPICGHSDIQHYILFLRINVTENNFSHMGNWTHDLGPNRLTHRSRTLYHIPPVGILTSSIISHLSGSWHLALYPICDDSDFPLVSFLTSNILSHL